MNDKLKENTYTIIAKEENREKKVFLDNGKDTDLAN